MLLLGLAVPHTEASAELLIVLKLVVLVTAPLFVDGVDRIQQRQVILYLVPVLLINRNRHWLHILQKFRLIDEHLVKL